MFADIHHFQTLLSHWPAADIWTKSVDGDMDSYNYKGVHIDMNHIDNAQWNYGANFAGGLQNTEHGPGGKGMFGDSYIMDEAYSYAYGGDAEYAGNPGVKMCMDEGCSRNHFNYSNLWKAHDDALAKYNATHGTNIS